MKWRKSCDVSPALSFPQTQIQNNRWLLRFEISLVKCGWKTFDAFSEWKHHFQFSPAWRVLGLSLGWKLTMTFALSKTEWIKRKCHLRALVTISRYEAFFFASFSSEGLCLCMLGTQNLVPSLSLKTHSCQISLFSLLSCVRNSSIMTFRSLYVQREVWEKN